MDFFLFILVNAALFIRPAEIVPGLADFQLYQYLIIPCLVVALPSVLDQLRGGSLAARPITICVLGLFLAVLLSHLSRFNVDRAAETGFAFAKVTVYYLLFVGIVNSPARLRAFLFWVVLLIAAVTLLAVLQYHELISMSTPTAMEDRRITELGEKMVMVRLRGTGIFNDPNDFSLLLAIGIPISLYWLVEGVGFARVAWLAPLMLFGYALKLTESRGGLLGVLLGVMALFLARFGAARAAVLALVLVPAGLVFLAGGSREVLTTGDTAQERFQMWQEGLTMLRESPVFGVGMDDFAKENTDERKLVAHNSFVHCYAELGLFGGTLFLGTFFYAIWAVYRYRPEKSVVGDPVLQRLQPYLFGLICGYAGCILALSRSYIVPTYMVMGLATAYLGMVAVYSPVPVPRFDSRLVQRLAVAGVGFLLVTYVLVRVLVRWR